MAGSDRPNAPAIGTFSHWTHLLCEIFEPLRRCFPNPPCFGGLLPPPPPPPGVENPSTPGSRGGRVPPLLVWSSAVPIRPWPAPLPASHSPDGPLPPGQAAPCGSPCGSPGASTPPAGRSTPPCTTASWAGPSAGPCRSSGQPVRTPQRSAWRGCAPGPGGRAQGGGGGQGCIRREGVSEAAPEAVRRAVAGGCQGGWRLLSDTNAIEAGTWRQGDCGWAWAGRSGVGGGGWNKASVSDCLGGGGTSPPSNASLGGSPRAGAGQCCRPGAEAKHNTHDHRGGRGRHDWDSRRRQ